MRQPLPVLLDAATLLGSGGVRAARGTPAVSQSGLALPGATPISPPLPTMQAAAIMVKHDVGRLSVVENSRVIGILTRSDVMRFFYDLLPA